MDYWKQILDIVNSEVSPECFNTWFEPTRLEELSSNEIIVRVPNKYFKEWITENFSDLIQEAQEALKLSEYRVKFIVDTLADANGYLKPEKVLRSDKAAQPLFRDVQLNPRYRFDSFIVGSSNQFAHAACMAVADNPATSYNPLYIYGGVGFGKTHLMQAIGHHLLAKNPQLKLVYMSSERFMNELINSIRYNKMLQFREKYRNIDVLLVDDIQFLSGKDKTQEEFFHSFNALYDAQKQIVISSDCQPKELPNIEERLQSRFDWGLIADIQPPEFETKMAILRKKAEMEGVDIPDDVAHYIASNIKSNIRELEGSLIRLIAYSSLMGEKLDLNLAKRVLTNIKAAEERVITIEKIQKVVSNFFKIKTSDLLTKSNQRAIAEPRQIAMYLCKKMTDYSLPKIGKEFGGKHHTTVLYAVQKIEKMKESNPELRSVLNRLRNLID
ncbi:MAG: chromosomal replication initiator protein DnaA [Acidobacteria bacterium]|nr:chromosomal replication initiator protein DnaA [Acidobacteriota bacterium]